MAKRITETELILPSSRFNLLHYDDSVFLNFLCEMIHPLVRDDSSKVNKLLQIFNDNLNNDNYEIVEKSKISLSKI